MAEGFTADTEQMRRHAQRIEALRDRFDAVKAASAHIAGNDDAYGVLCRWMVWILEERHTRQDELIAYAQENLSLAAESLRAAARQYEDTDSDNEATLSKLARQAPRSV
jgi:Excreted virulence factor EspC, type VII ESX diderm